MLSPRTNGRHSAFTLVELLLGLGTIAILMVLAAPVFTKIKTANDITTAGSTIVGVLEQARNYAMANTTYVWVGFYEEEASAAVPSNATPPYPGKGRVLIADALLPELHDRAGAAHRS